VTLAKSWTPLAPGAGATRATAGGTLSCATVAEAGRTAQDAAGMATVPSESIACSVSGHCSVGNSRTSEPGSPPSKSTR